MSAVQESITGTMLDRSIYSVEAVVSGGAIHEANLAGEGPLQGRDQDSLWHSSEPMGLDQRGGIIEHTSRQVVINGVSARAP